MEYQVPSTNENKVLGIAYIKETQKRQGVLSKPMLLAVLHCVDQSDDSFH